MNAGRAVLVVDDRSEIFEIVLEMLMSHGFEVHCANEGTEAIGVLNRHRR